MDVSKRLHVCIKKMGAFYTLMDKPTRTLFQLTVRALMNVLELSFSQNLKVRKILKASIFLNSKTC